MKIVNCQQHSDEWFKARLGKATASRFSDILAEIKSGEAASRRNYRAQLICEILTGSWEKIYETHEMREGTENEPLARVEYEMATGFTVHEIGFCLHDSLDAGCSPDGLIGDDGLIQIKCPNTANHLETLIDDEVPSKYMAQIQGEMWVTGRQWSDFVSYDPRLPANLQLVIKRVPRDEVYIKRLENKLISFLKELHEEVNKLYAWQKRMNN